MQEVIRSIVVTNKLIRVDKTQRNECGIELALSVSAVEQNVALLHFNSEGRLGLDLKVIIEKQLL